MFSSAFGQLWAQRGWSLPDDAGRVYLEVNEALDPGWGVGAFLGDKLVGICYAHPRGRTGGIGPMAVVPEAWGSGAAREMLRALLARPEMAEAESVRLLVSSWNERAVAFYARHGFAAMASVGLFTLNEAPAPPRPSSGRRTRPLGADEIDLCLALDRDATGVNRPQDLRFFADRGVLVACEDGDGEVVAFAGGYPAAYEADGTAVGPLVAADLDALNRVVAAAIELSGRALHPPATLRVPLSSASLTAALLKAGARLTNIELLLVRGSWTFSDRALVGFAMLPESN